MKRILAVLMIVTVVLCFMPTMAFASVDTGSSTTGSTSTGGSTTGGATTGGSTTGGSTSGGTGDTSTGGATTGGATTGGSTTGGSTTGGSTTGGSTTGGSTTGGSTTGGNTSGGNTFPSGGGYVSTVQKPEIIIVGHGKAELSADGTTATITPDEGNELVSVVLNGKDMGKVDKLTGLKTGDKVVITFQAKADKAEMDKMVAEKVGKLQLIARSSKTGKDNIKVIVKGDLKAIEDAGYTVKYKFYRSTKKSSGFKAMMTKSSKTYYNTYGKKGQMYYYRVKVMVYDADGQLTAQTMLKQCKYANRLWTK